jgi:hexokinase
VAGKYLGHLLKAVLPESDFDPETGSEGLVKLAHESPEAEVQTETARWILDRSSRMVAACLAGLMKLLNKPRFFVVAEGGLFWRAPGYKELTESTLRSVLIGLGCGDLEFRFKEIPEANLKGSALAALV